MRALSLVCILLVSFTAFGQSNYASLRGTVSDEQHSMLPDAAVTLSSTATGALRSTRTNTQGLFDLPGFPNAESSLAFRNLKRGEALGLPSGQDVAKLVGAKPLTWAQLKAPEPTPLWFYILKESEKGGGRHLGQVGGEIVADVLLGLLAEDNHSFVNQNPTFKPSLGKGGRFELADLVRFALS